MKLFVWDFHGTLEKGNEKAVLEITNKILRDSGYDRQMSVDENSTLYGKKWYEYFQYLLPKESLDRCLDLQRKCVEYENKHQDIVRNFIKQNDYANVVLSKIKDAGHDQILITNTAKVAFMMFVQIVGISEIFPIGKKSFTTNLHQKHSTLTKRQVLENYLKGKNFNKIIVVGDRGSDVELAGFVGGTSYLYAHPGKDFFECLADYKIRDLRKILAEL